MLNNRILSSGNDNGSTSLFRYIDWPTIILYLLLVIAVAVCIYAASSDYDNAS